MQPFPEIFIDERSERFTWKTKLQLEEQFYLHIKKMKSNFRSTSAFEKYLLKEAR